MGKTKVLVKVRQEEKHNMPKPKILNRHQRAVKPTLRVALRSDSYTLHKTLPNKVDSLVSLMMLEKVRDGAYEMVGGLNKESKEVVLPAKHPKLFEAFGESVSLSQKESSSTVLPELGIRCLLVRLLITLTMTFIRVSGSELVQKYVGEVYWRGQ